MKLGLTFFSCVFGQWCEVGPGDWRKVTLAVGAYERNAKWKCLYE